jgi:hypothetical protein
MSRSTVERLLLCVAMASLLGSCSSPSDDVPSQADPPGAGHPTPAVTTDQGRDFFTAGEADSVDSWWTSDPSLAPADQEAFTLTFNERFVGPQSIHAGGIGAKTARVVITCSEPVAYSVNFGTEDDPEEVTTAGDSCGGPDINAYDTPVLNDDVDVVTVAVPDDTAFFVTIYTLNA